MQTLEGQSYWLPKVRIIDDSYNENDLFSIGISDEGIITHILAFSSDNQAPENYQVVELEDETHISVGWCDMRAFVPEPGQEFKETLDTASKAALLGGFTQVALLPNTNPTLQSKEQVKAILHRSDQVEWLPIAALTNQTEGLEMTQMYDLHQAGAIAFSDGLNTTSHTGVLLRTLEYAKAFDGLVVQLAQDKYLSGGMMHEGIYSTLLGMKGIPSLSEEMAILKDLELLRYTDSKIHFSTISTGRSVDIIRKAKEEGLRVTCDIASYQLSFLDEDLQDFDTFKKVSPPFRTHSDKEALLDGLRDGTIDAVVSNHNPQDEEAKKLEFDLADFGIINLQTSFSAIRSATNDKLPLMELIKKLTTAPRGILRLEQPKIQEGEKANLTVFYPNKKWTFKQEHILSKSKNSPFIGVEMMGKIVGVCNGNSYVSFE